MCNPQIILEIRKEGDQRVPTWIIIGSTLGGLLLLALLSLALWKVRHWNGKRELLHFNIFT